MKSNQNESDRKLNESNLKAKEIAKQTEFNLKIINEGLVAISASFEEQVVMNDEGLIYLDDVFDPMPLDYLTWLEEQNEISSEFANEFRNLYNRINKKIDHLSWQKVDVLISSNDPELKFWRKIARQLLDQLTNG